MRAWIAGVAALAVVAAFSVAPAAPAARAKQAGPRFRAAQKLVGADGITEPRMVVGPDDRRWIVTNERRTAVVFSSGDRGATWRQTRSTFQNQTRPSIDVDIAVLPNGRLVATELDSAGVNFPTAYSDDDGGTWTWSTGTQIADMDRQWLAVGPVDPLTHKNRVYLAYHNLVSGFGNHNMFVMTSTDGGASFGPPVPTTVPGQQAYLDLQCADSGGPSSLMVNQQTGKVYLVFGTRSSSTAGGCASTPAEVNIVSATRIWVAMSPDNAPGSWTQSLAVDRSQTGTIVGMQLSPGTLDSQGNVLVVFPESPRPYPDFSGAAIRVTQAPPDLSSWSEPITIVKGGGAGNLLPHIVAGDPGKISVGYFHGVSRVGKAPAWYTHVATTYNLSSKRPRIVDRRVASVASFTWTASEMMGACTAPSPVSGVLNGFGCNRSSDVWGMALDAGCRVMLTWPAAKDLDGLRADPGTWVSTQNGGEGLCRSGRKKA
ncbi:MAG: hypothetical protein NVSMB57_05800 [Actinomycetota bacterium]